MVVVTSTKQENFYASALLISVDTGHTFVVYVSVTFVRNNFRSGVQRFGVSWFLHVDRQKHGTANKRIFATVRWERFRKLELQLPKYPPKTSSIPTAVHRSRFRFHFQGRSLQYVEVLTQSLQVFRTAYTQRFITWISRQGILLPALCTRQITWDSSSSTTATVSQRHFTVHKVLNLTKDIQYTCTNTYS